MNALTSAAPRLSLLIPRLASDQDGEVVAVVRAIGRVLAASKLDWHDLAASLTSAPKPDQPKSNLTKIAADLRQSADRLTQRERDFLASVSAMIAHGRDLTAKQEKWLRDLHLIHVGSW